MESTNSTAPNTKNGAPTRKRIVKIVIRLLIGLALIPVLLTAYFYIGGIEWGDWTIPDEAELRHEKRDVPDEDNAYIALMSLTNLYHVADNDQVNEKSGDDSAKVVSDKDFVKYYGNLLNSEGWEDWAAVRSDPASPIRAERILADNAKFFEACRAALSFKYFVDTDARLEDAKRRKEGKNPWVSYLPPYKPFIEFAQLVALRAQVALEHDEVESAVSAIGEIHALGQLVMVNNESLVAYLVGVLIDKISFGKMCDVVAMGKATDEVVERFSKMVAVSEANAPTAWKRALTVEAASHSERVEWICDHPTQIIGALLFRNFDERGNITSPSLLCRILTNGPGFAKFSFHRRELLYRQAMLDRAMLAGDDDLMEMILHEMPRNPLLPNFAGNFWVCSLCPFLNPYAKSGSLDRIRPRLVIAAEKWRRAHGGENPPALDALVPDYLAAVPKDPWSKSGGPIKYDAESGVAWSVGKEGEYDYRKVAKERKPADADKPLDGDTQTYAFRLDAKPIVTPVVSPSSTSTISAEAIQVQADESQPSNVEAAYASEVIPVIENLRIMIKLYQYEKDAIPCIWGGTIKDPHIETWIPQANSRYIPAYSSFSGDVPPLKPMRYERADGENSKKGHWESLLDIDHVGLHLLGKCSKPNHYQYLVMLNYDAPPRYYAYFLGCFGDGDGLPKGTGYAVCEIYAKDRKYNGTWKRYKSVGKTSANEEVQACFTSGTERPVGDTNPIHTFGCFVPDKASFDKLAEENGELEVIDKMKKYGWEFSVL